MTLCVPRCTYFPLLPLLIEPIHIMNYQQEDIESKNIDHLGIITGIIDEIGIVEKINEIFSVDSREKVNY
jgi:hypothetical protein